MENSEKKLLSKLLIIKSDLENVNPKDYEDMVRKKLVRIKNAVEFLVKNLISRIER